MIGIVLDNGGLKMIINDFRVIVNRLLGEIKIWGNNYNKV